MGRGLRVEGIAMGEPSGSNLCPRPRVSADLIGDSLAMRQLRQTITTVASSDATVLITGSSGTGKENAARALHAASARSGRQFEAVNCGAIPLELAEAELFGAEAGAYTGASGRRIGRLEAANGGTLFLDEIGELPLPLQVKLLRALETQEITRLGSTRPVALDFRLVAATNVDLSQAVAEREFREDLYWRLAVVQLELPPLVQRREDIPALVGYFADRLQRRLRLTDCGRELLLAHDWPGNLRELRNLVERTLAYNESVLNQETVERLLMPAGRPVREWLQGGAEAGIQPRPSTLAQRLQAAGDAIEPVALKQLLAEAEERLILQALQQANGMVAESARLLGLKRTTLVEKMKRMGLKAANEAA